MLFWCDIKTLITHQVVMKCEKASQTGFRMRGRFKFMQYHNKQLAVSQTPLVGKPMDKFLQVELQVLFFS